MEATATYIFVFLAGLASLLLLFTKNVMHAAYLLMIVLTSLAAIFIQLNAEFIGVAQLMVYVGGILILLIFGIMLTNRINGEHIISDTHHSFIGFLFGTSLMTGLSFLILAHDFSAGAKPDFIKQANIRSFGQELMTDYIFEFEIIGILLLLVLIGAAFIAKYDHKPSEDGHSE